MSEQSQSSWQDRLVRQARQQPGRAGLMVVLLATMAALWGRQLLSGGRGVPAAAQAAPPAQSLRVPEKALTQGQKALTEWLTRPAAPRARRNLFAVRLEYFPADATAQSAEPVRSSGGIWGELAKSFTAKADQEKARRVFAQNIRAMASKLDLQSTIMGQGDPKALVNGKMVEQGAVVEGFRIVRIESGRMVVEREGVKLEVLLKF